MNRVLSLILSLILLCTAVSAASADTGTVTVHSDTNGFSTLVPAGKSVEFDEDGNLYVWLGEEGYTPNLWIGRFREGLDDPEEYIHEDYPEYMEEQYEDRLASEMLLESYEIGGKSLPAAVFAYRGSSGNLIYQVMLAETRNDGNVIFQARYNNDTEAETLAALDAAVRNYRPDGAQASVPQGGSGQQQQDNPPPQDGPGQQGSPSPEGAHSFTVTSIKQDNMIIGRCVAPVGYTVTSTAYCCTENQSAGNPWFLSVQASSPNGISMEYMSGRDFYTDSSTTDGGYVLQYMTPSMHYMTAAEYCDYWATRMNPGASISLVEDNDYPGLQSMLRRKEQDYLNTLNSMGGSLGLTAERDSWTVCARCYYVAGGGRNSYFIAATATHGVWCTASMAGPFLSISSSYTLWESPYVFTMSCPESLFNDNADVFTVFMENTSVNDQFLLANQRLSTELQSMMTGIDLTGIASYGRQVMQDSTASGDDYSSERFTDYIFDENDYTLSDGSHIKVSTAYDYVYEGDNGVVYYSNSAFSQPGGSTQLTPNR